MTKQWLWVAAAAVLLGNTGCCRWADRWCNRQPTYSAQACVPCPPVCCPAPAGGKMPFVIIPRDPQHGPDA